MLMPNRACDRPVAVERDLPGVIIVVHGVNDLGVSYHAIDNGLCEGLNERLNRADLFPNDYTLPKDDDPLQPDPDKIYFRLRVNQATRSPVIPFYWGYRAAKGEIGRELVRGQVVDVHGNRLDKDFAKGGGMFANATSNIPDMFSGRFNRGLLVWFGDKVADDAHPLLTGPERRYMVLAAKRLAALVAEIRAIAADDTVTLIGHSQGCLVSLLAQAFLAEDGQRCADCLILNNPPYGIHEPLLDTLTQSGVEQQTTQARINTLANLVELVTRSPHGAPPLTALFEPATGRGRAGPKWSPTQGARPNCSGNCADPTHVFGERDNRGKVYLYFCPHDLTVGLANVQGIGSLGVPAEVDTLGDDGRSVTLPVLTRLGERFFQRVWTWRERNGSPVQVGDAPKQHVLRVDGEPGFDVNFWTRFTLAGIPQGDARSINAEPLNPPLTPQLHHGELARDTPAPDPRYVGHIQYDPIDAAVAVTKGKPRTVTRTVDWAEPRIPSAREYQAHFNERITDETQHTRVQSVVSAAPGKIKVTRTETPDEMRARYQDADQEQMKNSYHSAIVTNSEHHRWVTAMDVAIGQARALDDPDWRRLLIAIADWRTAVLEGKSDFKNYALLGESTRALVEATATYYKTGEFPKEGLVPSKIPGTIDSRTLKSRTEKSWEFHQ